MLRFVGEKMSKSLGNVVTLRDAIEEWGRETILLFFLSAHWRKPIDYSDDALGAAAGAGGAVSRRLPRPVGAGRRR